ncbi:hypothetical protein HLB23_08260 [Nocardia uniformis]|uniref:MmyB-like transcription regulator ligand binding domain-containing protein n=1 Tax=Nocardia uniformis TaxID=53432 RepID=A0A849BXD7_9NOCA|nr:hypothetical protein [Nocardia uniformis]NNH69858.1 hypothetical protein [Nocardia uniformis]
MSEPGLCFSSSILPVAEQLRPADLAVLHAFPYPAGFRTAGTCDVIAANAASVAMFPGLEAGSNLLTWMMLDPMARCVLVDWEDEARLLVQQFRQLARVSDSHRAAEILTLCRRATDWDRLWDSELTDTEAAQRIMVVREPDTGHERAMYAQTFSFEAPPRPWRLYTLVPVD